MSAASVSPESSIGAIAKLSARSVLASTLLGSHPPCLPGRLLVALAAEFGIAEGTARVALSRMVERGELTNSEGVYALAGPLLVRQQRQDRTLPRRSDTTWDGSWQQAVITASARPAAQRAATRLVLSNLKLSELREGVWMRPANLDPRRLADQQAQLAGSVAWFLLEVEQPADLVAQLWDLPRWQQISQQLIAAMEGAAEISLRDGFELSAAVLRHLLADPELPAQIAPDDWPDTQLRGAYDRFDSQYRAQLTEFFRRHGGWEGKGQRETADRQRS